MPPTSCRKSWDWTQSHRLMTQGRPDAAVDNDVLIKASCYGLTERLDEGRELGVLGAARFVVDGRLDRMVMRGDRAAARAAAAEVIARNVTLEPSPDEEVLAAGLETAALRAGLELDAGESQLAAIAIRRGIAVVETGDKRAIRAFDVLLDDIPDLGGLRGRLRCFEQVAARFVDIVGADELARCVCAEPEVDKALSICCSCFSAEPCLDPDGLAGYVEDLRARAARVLAPY